MNTQLTPQDIQSIIQLGKGFAGDSSWKDLLKETKLLIPEFKMDGMFTVVFHRVKEKSSRKSSGERIIELIRNNASVTTRELADIIGISDKGIEYQLAKLQKEGILTREGSKKSGIWIVNEIDN